MNFISWIALGATVGLLFTSCSNKDLENEKIQSLAIERFKKLVKYMPVNAREQTVDVKKTDSLVYPFQAIFEYTCPGDLNLYEATFGYNNPQWIVLSVRHREHRDSYNVNSPMTEWIDDANDTFGWNRLQRESLASVAKLQQ